MMIENPDALKGWLTSCLEPLCDADPAALAKYVMALVKKDKPENELKDICLDQLDVFLQKETKSFVDILFDTLNTRSYLQLNVPSAPVTNSVLVLNSNENNSAVAVNGNTSVIKPNNRPIHGNISSMALSSIKHEKPERKSRDVPVLELKDSHETKMFPHRSRSRTRSRSKSPPLRSSNRPRSRSRENEDRRGGRHFSDEERRRRSYHSRRFENNTRHRAFRDRRPVDPMDRDRERDRERENRTIRERERKNHEVIPSERESRSRSKSRSGSSERARSRSRSWSSPARSRSRSWSRSRDRTKDTRSDTRGTRTKSDTPQHSIDHGDRDYRMGSSLTNSHKTTPDHTGNLPGTQQSIMTSQFGNKTTKRCQDYDEKGYCMRGDLCLYDHGADPVVVEDVSVLGFPHSTAPASQAPPNNAVPVLPQILPPPPPRSGSPLPPPLPPQQPPPPPPPETYVPEPYNPEAPGMDNVPLAFWSPPRPPPHPPGVSHVPHPPQLPHPPPQHPPPPGLGGLPFNPNGPPPPMFHSLPQRTRELIGVPTVNDAALINITPPDENPRLNENPSSKRSRPVNSSSETNTTHVTDTVPSVGSFQEETHHTRKNFDYNRLGSRKPLNINSDRCTLELRKVPRNLNTIAELNDHFSKFGTIVNLQVCYNHDPEAALIQFLNNSEATSAYRSTEAVLNNRFIKVFWHSKDSENSAMKDKMQESDSHGSVNKSDKISVKDRLGNLVTNAKLNSIPSNIATSNKVDSSERAVVFSPTGNLSRTVFNPSALRKNNVPGCILSGISIKNYKEDPRKVALKKRFQLHIKRQTVLKNHVENQKILLEKLENCKSEKDKLLYKQMLAELDTKLKQLQADSRKDAEEIGMLTKGPNHKSVKNKSEAEKELLDAEMDLYNKQHKGDDTTELRRKVNELKQQAKALGLLDSNSLRGRGIRGGRRAVGSYHIRSRGASLLSSRKLDHRPRKILIKEMHSIDKETFRRHFMQYGEVESAEQTACGLVVSFKTRKEAEMAISAGARLNEHILNMAWYQELSSNKVEQSSEHSEADLNNPEDDPQSQQLLEEMLLLGDDEEEEDSEARSWRR